MSYSYDDVYVLHAWRDNRRRLVLTQGEGYSGTLSGNYTVKAPHFQLMDERGTITIPSDTAVSMAITLPNGNEDLIACYPVDKPNGIFCCPIRTTMTSQAGEVKGEVRLTTASNTVVKFYGVVFYVYDGVSNDAAAQSPAFDALAEALSKVEAVTAGGSVATLDSVIQHGGTHPVVSGLIYDFVDGNYAHYKAISGNEADTANNSRTIYVHSAGGGFKGLIFFTGYNNYAGAATVKQFRLCKDGKLEYRTGTVVTPTTTPNTYTWDKAYDADWNPIGSTQNIQDLAITTVKIANGAVTSVKIGNGEVKTINIDGGAVTTPKIANEGVTPAKLDRTYTEFRNINSADVDTATTNGIIYKVSLDGRTNYLFCVNSGSNLLTQYRFDTQGYAKYRTKSSSAGSWSDWYSIATTQNIQDLAVTTAKLHDGAVTVAKLDIDDPDTLVKLLEGKAIYYHKTNNQAPVETMYTKYPIPTLWCTGSKYYMLSGRTNGSSSGSYNYTINKLPSDATIAGLSLHSSITSIQLKSALGYCEVQQRDRIPTDADIGVVGDKWVAQLTDSNNNVYYEIYELQRYYTEDDAPTVTLYGWEKMIYFSETNRVTVWDAATSALNNYIVPTSQVGKTGDIIVVSPASGTGGEVWQLTKVVSAYGTKTYIWEQQVFASSLTSYMKKAYSADGSPDIANVPTGQLFFSQGSVAIKTGETASDFFELVKMTTLNTRLTNLTNQLKISTFSYSLTANGWSSNQQAITIPAGYVVPGDVMADVEIDSTAYNQLVQDGCTGLYISSVTSGNTLTLTAHALGNAPTAAVTIQVTLTPVTDLSE